MGPSTNAKTIKIYSILAINIYIYIWLVASKLHNSSTENYPILKRERQQTWELNSDENYRELHNSFVVLMSI